MKLTSLLLVLSLSLVKSDLEQEECGGPLSDTPFDDILKAFQYYSTCTYPAHLFNVNCLLSSCPSLSGVCPLTSNGRINKTALMTAVSILNTCIGQNGLICNYNMTHKASVQLGCTTAQILPASVVNGTATLIHGTGYMENLSHATFTLPQNISTSGPIMLAIQALRITTTAKFNCIFNIVPTSFINPLKGIIPGLNSLNMPDMKGILNINTSFTLSVDLTTPNPTINTSNDQFQIILVYSNFISTNGVALDQNLVNQFNIGMNIYVKESVLHSTVNNFLSTYATIGLQAAQLNCS